MSSLPADIKRLWAHLVNGGIWKEVEDVLFEALKKDRTNPEILSLLGDVAFRRRDYKQAGVQYDFAAQFDDARLQGLLPMQEWDRARVSQLKDRLSERVAICRMLSTSGGAAVPTALTGVGDTFLNDIHSGNENYNLDDPLLQIEFVGLGTTQPNYVNAAREYLVHRGLDDVPINVYASGSSANAVLHDFNASPLADTIVGLFNSDGAEVDTAGLANYHKALAMQNLHPRVEFVHLDEQDDLDRFVRVCIARRLLTAHGYHLDGPLTVVVLNRVMSATPVEKFDHPYPIVLITTPYAARTRFIPTFINLAAKVGREVQQPNLFVGHPSRHPRLMENGRGMDFEESGKYFAAMNLEFYDIMEIHRSFPWKRLRGDEMLRAIMLMRDPRDMCVSENMFINAHSAGGTNVSDQMTQWLRKFAKPIAEDMIQARDAGAYLHRFEDVNADEWGSWKKMLAWLGWQHRIDDETLRAAIHLGSFEYQSGGKAKRGESDVARIYQPGTTPIRKGVSGDWRNHFTEAHKDLCKSVIGHELVELGYESDLGW